MLSRNVSIPGSHDRICLTWPIRVSIFCPEEVISRQRRNNTTVARSKTSKRVRLHLIDVPPEVDLDRDHPDQPELAQAQLAQSATWKHPAELCPNWTHSSNNVEPQDIAQRIISDCSVCASIVICLAHHKRFSSKVHLPGVFCHRYLIMATVRTIISPSAPCHAFGRVTNTLPIRRRIPLQRRFATCESPGCLHPPTCLTDMLQIGTSPLALPIQPARLFVPYSDR